MSWSNLPTNYVDATWEGDRKYTIDLKVSGGRYENATIDDTTSYNQPQSGTYFYGANDANQTNGAINSIVGALGNDINNIVAPVSHGGTGATTTTGARTNLEVLKGYTIFDSSPTHNDISIYNLNSYSYIDIYYRTVGLDPDAWSSVRAICSTGTHFALSLTTCSGTNFTFRSMLCNIGGNDKLTFSKEGVMWYENGSIGSRAATSSTDYIFVSKVIGYKY